MKYSKMLGLAAVAAGAMMAFLGAGTASGTVLCEETPAAGSDCSSKVPVGTVIDLSMEPSTSSLWKGPFGESITTCAEGTIKGAVAGAGGPAAPVSISNESFTFSSCNRPVTVTAPGTLAIHHIAGTDDGTLTSSGARWTVHNVPLFGSCNYETNATDIGRITGNTASAPTFDVGASIKSTNGCPTGTWSGSYVYTGSTKFNVSAGTASGTVLCEETPAAGSDCSSKVPVSTVIDLSMEPSTSSLWKGPFGETIGTCSEGTIKGAVTGAGGPAATVSINTESFTFGSCNRPVTVTAPGTLAIHHIAGTDDGTLTSSGARWTVHNVPLFGSCNYETNATDIGRITGKTASAPTFDVGASIKSTNGCPTGTWSGAYGYTGSTNFVVAAG